MIFVLCIGSLSACTKVRFTKGFGKDEVFRIENESCNLSEMMVYLTTTQNQYESVYGEEIWNTNFNEITLTDNVKDTVLAKIAQIKTMYLLAKSKEITLTEEENALVEVAAKEYYNSLNETERTLMGVDLDTIKKLYNQYAMADKVYLDIIQDINPEISDDEARTITVQHILAYKQPEGATTNPETSKAQAYQKALDAQQKAVAGEQTFEELATKYSEDENITISFGKGVMEAEIEQASFQLETNEISPVIETETAYHVMKCITTFNREETDANKLKIVEQRRKEAFAQEYDVFVNSLVRSLNEEVWENVAFIHDTKVTTLNFFDTYMAHFTE